MSDFDKDHPDKSAGAWCGDCGAALRPNVPRLGFAAGAIHAKTGRLDCKDAPPDESQITFAANGREQLYARANKAANAIIAQQADEAKRLQDQIDELTNDKARLDWMESQASAKCVSILKMDGLRARNPFTFAGVNGRMSPDSPTIRDAIDAAMQSTQ